MRKVILYPGEDGYIVAECPSLPGCISQGDTRSQAIENIKDAISLYIKTLIEDGEAHTLSTANDVDKLIFLR
jgi:predicted RNase H-like HicB family nuclease